MAKIKKTVVEYYSFYCPGCKHEHVYTVSSDKSQWHFNGSHEYPSFTPSLLNREMDKNKVTGNYDVVKSICHLFVTDGKIIYCNDCTHELSGKIIEMIDPQIM